MVISTLLKIGMVKLLKYLHTVSIVKKQMKFQIIISISIQFKVFIYFP